MSLPETTTERSADGPRLVSINVGRVETLRYRGRQVATGIFKRPVEGPVMVPRLNLDGDKQADLKVHGGVDKAVYLYPAESYEAWRAELGRELPYGHFGENLTLRGLLEDAIHVGDILELGEVRLEVTQPRLPCFKLGIKMGSQRFLKTFLNSGRSGFYCRVLQEGLIEAGQAITLRGSGDGQPSIAEVVASHL